MMKDLIRTMGFLYRFASLGRGKLTRAQLEDIAAAGDTLTQNAETVMGDAQGFTPDERTDLEEAVMMEQHITEIVEWMMKQEIV